MTKKQRQMSGLYAITLDTDKKKWYLWVITCAKHKRSLDLNIENL